MKTISNTEQLSVWSTCQQTCPNVNMHELLFATILRNWQDVNSISNLLVNLQNGEVVEPSPVMLSFGDKSSVGMNQKTLSVSALLYGMVSSRCTMVSTWGKSWCTTGSIYTK